MLYTARNGHILVLNFVTARSTKGFEHCDRLEGHIDKQYVSHTVSNIYASQIFYKSILTNLNCWQQTASFTSVQSLINTLKINRLKIKMRKSENGQDSTK